MELNRNLKYIKLQRKWYCHFKKDFLTPSTGHEVTTAALEARAFPHGQQASLQSIQWRNRAYVSFTQVNMQTQWNDEKRAQTATEVHKEQRCAKNSWVSKLAAWLSRHPWYLEGFVGSSGSRGSWMGRPEWPWDLLVLVLPWLWALLWAPSASSLESFEEQEVLYPDSALWSPACPFLTFNLNFFFSLPLCFYQY